jgi:hypothetical protein
MDVNEFQQTYNGVGGLYVIRVPTDPPRYWLGSSRDVGQAVAETLSYAYWPDARHEPLANDLDRLYPHRPGPGPGGGWGWGVVSVGLLAVSVSAEERREMGIKFRSWLREKYGESSLY